MLLRLQRQPNGTENQVACGIQEGGVWRGAGDGSDDAAIKEVRVEQNGLSQGDAKCWERSRCMLPDASIMFLSSSVDRQWWHIVWDSRSMRQGWRRMQLLTPERLPKGSSSCQGWCVSSNCCTIAAHQWLPPFWPSAG